MKAELSPRGLRAMLVRRGCWCAQRSPPVSRTPVNLNPDLDSPRLLASLIDHTLLKPEATRSDIARICAEARQFEFASVCINPYWVRFSAEALAGSRVRVCTVIGFPLGANETRTKVFEAELALSEGASELDMVQNIGALRSQQHDQVQKEIAGLARLSHEHGAILKVILETCLLTDDEKVTACRIAKEAGADFVKTSTGFSNSGATVEDIQLMREAVGESLGVKASGGIRTLESVRAMVAAGATRIGTSSGVAILTGLSAAETPAAPTALHAAKVPGGHIDAY
jgi:deoxyribose-phosphate aldolase